MLRDASIAWWVSPLMVFSPMSNLGLQKRQFVLGDSELAGTNRVFHIMTGSSLSPHSWAHCRTLILLANQPRNPRQSPRNMRLRGSRKNLVNAHLSTPRTIHGLVLTYPYSSTHPIPQLPPNRNPPCHLPLSPILTRRSLQQAERRVTHVAGLYRRELESQPTSRSPALVASCSLLSSFGIRRQNKCAVGNPRESGFGYVTRLTGS